MAKKKKGVRSERWGGGRIAFVGWQEGTEALKCPEKGAQREKNNNG